LCIIILVFNFLLLYFLYGIFLYLTLITVTNWWGNQRGRDHWGDLGVDGWIILGWISRRWDVLIWTELGWPRIETGGGRL
jgi:hypothetical protein